MNNRFVLVIPADDSNRCTQVRGKLHQVPIKIAVRAIWSLTLSTHRSSDQQKECTHEISTNE